jgi:hypothetical protein
MHDRVVCTARELSDTVTKGYPTGPGAKGYLDSHPNAGYAGKADNRKNMPQSMADF